MTRVFREKSQKPSPSKFFHTKTFEIPPQKFLATLLVLFYLFHMNKSLLTVGKLLGRDYWFLLFFYIKKSPSGKTDLTNDGSNFSWDKQLDGIFCVWIQLKLVTIDVSHLNANVWLDKIISIIVKVLAFNFIWKAFDKIYEWNLQISASNEAHCLGFWNFNCNRNLRICIAGNLRMCASIKRILWGLNKNGKFWFRFYLMPKAFSYFMASYKIRTNLQF